MKIEKPEGTKLICLTPVANEGFELDRFLQCTSLWADHIIVGYQKSMDNTLEILGNYAKVTIVHSPNEDWNELVMRSLLYDAARKVEADKRIIFNLDADELLSANYMTSAEWKTVLELPKGSIIRMRWCQLKSDMATFYFGNWIEVGFIDDGTSTLAGSLMHMGRVPWPNYDIKIMRCSEIRLLHFAFVNPERDRSKQRWYQTYEKVGKSEYGTNIFRKYHKKTAQSKTSAINPNWLLDYAKHGIDVTSVAEGYDYTHDYRLLDYLEEYGTEYFRTCDIWDMDWVQFATGKKENPERFKNPQNKFDKIIVRYWWWTINTKSTLLRRLTINTIDRILRITGYST